MTYIYNETGDERIWEDWQRPKNIGRWETGSIKDKEWQAYNSRPSYPVSDELKKIWVKGQKVDGKDFQLKPEMSNETESNGCGDGWKFKKPMTAIPLPEQSKPIPVQYCEGEDDMAFDFHKANEKPTCIEHKKEIAGETENEKTKNRILTHLKSLQQSLPDFINIIADSDASKNGDSYLEVIVKIRDVDYWIKHHLKRSKKQ